jgi:hypothetical protein
VSLSSAGVLLTATLTVLRLFFPFLPSLREADAGFLPLSPPSDRIRYIANALGMSTILWTHNTFDYLYSTTGIATVQKNYVRFPLTLTVTQH